MKKLKICLDPGHYANCNKGAVAGYYEGNMTLDLAQRLRKELENYGCEVILTRTTGADVPLETRGKMAEGCDVFISLHSDAAASASAHGCVVIRSLQRDASADLAKKLAAAVAGQMGRGYHYTADGVWTRAYPLTKTTDYYQVIREAAKTDCRYIYLIEHGFHTNPEDCRWIDSSANRQRLAEAEAACIASYFGLSKPQPEEKAPLTRFVTGGMTAGDAAKYREELRSLQALTGVSFTESTE